MKQLKIWILLGIYCCATFAPALPIVGDLFAHVLFYQSHMEYVHHGDEHSDHVHLSIVKMVKPFQDNSQSVSDGTMKVFELIQILPTLLIFSVTAIQSELKIYPSQVRTDLLTANDFGVFVPPDVS